MPAPFESLDGIATLLSVGVAFGRMRPIFQRYQPAKKQRIELLQGLYGGSKCGASSRRNPAFRLGEHCRHQARRKERVVPLKRFYLRERFSENEFHLAF